MPYPWVYRPPVQWVSYRCLQPSHTFFGQTIDRALLKIKTPSMTNQRIVERVSPLWLGIGISSTLLILMFLIETVTGRWSQLLIGGEFDPLASVDGGVLRDIRIAIIHCLVAGYLPAALLYAVRSGRRTVLELQKVLSCTSEECEALAKTVRLNTSSMVTLGLVAFGISLLTPYLIPPVPEAPWNPANWSPEVAWARILGPFTAVLSIWLAYAIISVSIRMSRIAKSLVTIDLLDPSPLAPFTQLGLSNALLQVGLLSIWSLIMIETGFGQLMLVICGMTLIGTAFALLAPVYGVHQRIRQSKEQALSWVNTELTAEQPTFLEPGTDQESGRMADLVAYRSMIGRVSEWPFTLSTYTRVTLYVLLPVVTWGVGLVAEEVLGRVLY